MNKIIKRIVRKVDVTFVSPVCVSNGDNGFVDAELMRDYNEDVFIPGSSIAGAMRDYLDLEYGIGSKDGDMSSFYISDLTFSNKPKTIVRDGIRLDSDKQTIPGAKYDMECIETGAKGYFFIELAIRECDDEQELLDELNKVLVGIESKEIRLGTKKTRGYGEIEIDQVKELTFDSSNYIKYKNAYNVNSYSNGTVIDVSTTNMDSKYTTISVPLKLTGGISIRKYSAIKGEPDFMQITNSMQKPVIPGTSFSGAIRGRCRDILINDLGYKYPNNLLTQIFGLEGNSNNKGHKSYVSFNEGVIENSKSMNMTRTSVSRFEANVIDGSLYKEKTYFNGDIELLVKIENASDWMIGLLLLAIHDLQKGYLALGGQAAIGRGIFLGNEVSLNGKVLTDENQYYSALSKVVNSND